MNGSHSHRRRLRRAGLTGSIGSFALIAAACGSAVYGSTPGTYATAPAAGSASAASAPYAASAGTGGAPAAITVKTSSTRLGTLLTDGEGRTLYLFEKDQPGMSACTGACLGVWPALTSSGPPQAGPGASMSLLSTLQRPDGTTAVAYAGHPLYLYAGDSNPGDANGQGLTQFGASWYVVSPAGSKIDND